MSIGSFSGQPDFGFIYPDPSPSPTPNTFTPHTSSSPVTSYVTGPSEQETSFPTDSSTNVHKGIIPPSPSGAVPTVKPGIGIVVDTRQLPYRREPISVSILRVRFYYKDDDKRFSATSTDGLDTTLSFTPTRTDIVIIKPKDDLVPEGVTNAVGPTPTALIRPRYQGTNSQRPLEIVRLGDSSSLVHQPDFDVSGQVAFYSSQGISRFAQ